MKAGKRSLANEATKYMLLIVAVVIFIVFAVANPMFASVNNIMNIINSTAITAMLGIGMTIVMQTGQMDLAVGAEATIAAAVVGKILEGPGFNNYFLAVLIGLAAAAAVGALNAFFVVWIGIPSFIGTIAMSTFINGFIKIATGNRYMFSQYWPKAFTFLGQTRVFGVIPVPVIVLAVVAVLTIVMQDRMKIGRYINSVGMSPAACKNVGINVQKTVIFAYLICSVIAGFGGIVLSSEVKTISPTLGSDLLMTVFAAVMMGATFYRPGRYNLQGTIVSALLLSIISNGTITLGAADFVDDLVQGIVIVAAVGFISLTHKGGLPSVKFNQ